MNVQQKIKVIFVSVVILRSLLIAAVHIVSMGSQLSKHGTYASVNSCIECDWNGLFFTRIASMPAHITLM